MNYKEELERFHPFDVQESVEKEIMLKSDASYSDLLYRENLVTHFTSSAIILNRRRDHVLMVFHNIYRSWSWPGGHVDGEEDFLKVALKECEEETGVTAYRPIQNGIIALDIIPVQRHVRKGVYVPAHLHYNAAYLLEADEEEPLRVNAEENSGVAWIPLSELSIRSGEAHMIPIYEKILDRAFRS